MEEEQEEQQKPTSLKRSADEITSSDVALSTDSGEGEPQRKKRKRSSFFRVLKSSSPSPSPSATTPRRLPRVTPKSALKSVSFKLPNDDNDNDDDDNGTNEKSTPEAPDQAAIAERSFLDVVGIHTPVARRVSRAEALRKTLDEMDAPVRPLNLSGGNDGDGDNNDDGENSSNGGEGHSEASTEDTLQREWAVKTVLRFYSAEGFESVVPTEGDRTLALEHANAAELPPAAGPAARLAHAVQYFVLRNGEAKDGRLLDALSSLYALEAAGALPYFYVLGESFSMLVRDAQAYVHPPSILRAFTSKMNQNSAETNKNDNNNKNPDGGDENKKDNTDVAKESEESENGSDDDSDDSDDLGSPLKSAKARRMARKKKVTAEERELEALRENSGGFVPVRMPGDLTIEEVLAMAAESAARPPEVVRGADAVRALFEGLAGSSLAAHAVVLAPRAFPGGALERGTVRTYPVHRKTAPGVFVDVNALEVAGYVFNDRFRRLIGILKYARAAGNDGGNNRIDESFAADVDVVPPTAYFNEHGGSASVSPQPTTPGRTSSSSLVITTSSSSSSSSLSSLPSSSSSLSSAGLFVSGLKWSKSRGALSYTLTKK